MTVRGIDHAGMTVASLHSALGFYRDLLGLRVTGQGEDDGPELDAITGLSDVRMRYAELDLGGGQLLELVEMSRPPGRRWRSGPATPGRPTWPCGWTTSTPSTSDSSPPASPLPGRPTTITARGAWNGARCVYVEDPDGRTVELVQRPA